MAPSSIKLKPFMHSAFVFRLLILFQNVQRPSRSEFRRRTCYALARSRHKRTLKTDANGLQMCVRQRATHHVRESLQAY
ncbi:hypothetical protein PGT21_008543 [Puccinia graminis f. sp. tritici]|uniref:Uncharacterized protein n=1 Tax=Puccinia graminis f. sp. tritici TaxID=56615 RepID=A0A5B0PHP1_PUCGR|nr:hypothetical protein PGT21_008543 [Puccinia graminis f. sp. tritici]